jgi:hypothetical protein
MRKAFPPRHPRSHGVIQTHKKTLLSLTLIISLKCPRAELLHSDRTGKYGSNIDFATVRNRRISFLMQQEVG